MATSSESPKSTTSGSSMSGITSNTFQPSNAPKGDRKRILTVVLILLFIAALAGGLFIFQSMNKSSNLDLTQSENALAWDPDSVTGNCTGGRVIGQRESVPYQFDFTFNLSSGGRTGSVATTFNSSPSSGAHKIDADFTWNNLGTQGAYFGSLLRTGDRVTWSLIVRWTQNGQNKTETHTGSFTINDTSCGTAASPTPSPTATASVTPSATPSRSPSATPTTSPTATPTHSPSPSPSGTPPVGGPSNTPTPTPTATPTVAPTTAPPSSTSTPTNPPQSQSTPVPSTVADAQTQTQALPSAGINSGYLFLIAGFVSLVSAAIIALKKKRYY